MICSKNSPHCCVNRLYFWQKNIFYCTDSRENYFRSVGRQNNSNPNFTSAYVKSMKATRLLYFILSSKVIVRNMSTQVMYESNHISLLLDSRMSSVLKFLLFSIYCNLKEENPIRKKITSKKKKCLYVKTLFSFTEKQGLSGPYNKKSPFA